MSKKKIDSGFGQKMNRKLIEWFELQDDDDKAFLINSAGLALLETFYSELNDCGLALAASYKKLDGEIQQLRNEYYRDVYVLKDHMTQDQLDNEYMADLPVSFGSEELDEAVEDVKNGKVIVVEPGKLNEFLEGYRKVVI